MNPIKLAFAEVAVYSSAYAYAPASVYASASAYAYAYDDANAYVSAPGPQVTPKIYAANAMALRKAE